MSRSTDAIVVKNLKKSYGNTEVLRGVNLSVKRGTMLALLGPNGAGKTTTVRIMSTLLGFDDGTVTVEGHDVASEPDAVRSIIGLTGQSAAVDEILTGRENLIMMGQLYRLTKKSSVARAEELLEQFDLQKAANRSVKTYSGGMRRRLDLAVSLIATRPVIFLDEPTTGLDPRSRIAMWDIINKLKSEGKTTLLTTQYLEEADQLADSIVVIDGGKVIAEGTAKELKAKVGKDRLELTFADDVRYEAATKVLDMRITDANQETLSIGIMIRDTNKDVMDALNELTNASVPIESMAIHKPTLDDVFLNLTDGNKSGATAPEATKGQKK